MSDYGDGNVLAAPTGRTDESGFAGLIKAAAAGLGLVSMRSVDDEGGGWKQQQDPTAGEGKEPRKPNASSLPALNLRPLPA